MKSFVAITSEIDDIDLAVKELAVQLRNNIQFKDNSIGVAFCDADVDVANFGESLSKELNINIIGLTTTATIERYKGYNDMGYIMYVADTDDEILKIPQSEYEDKKIAFMFGVAAEPYPIIGNVVYHG